MMNASTSNNTSMIVTAGAKTYTGRMLNMSLAAANYYGRKSEVENCLNDKVITLECEEKSVEVERLCDQTEAGLEARKIQKDAVAAAELNLDIKQKSYEGGVLSAVYILNATQTMFSSKVIK